MLYEKKTSVYGDWVKGADLQVGMKAKIKTEATSVASQFKNKDGSIKMQDVCKIHFQGFKEHLNINLNGATIDGLIDAFGKDSKEWIDKVLIVHTEKLLVGGKRVTGVYLLPDGFEIKEDDDGFMKITKIGAETTKEETIEYPEEDIKAEDIPF